MSKKYKGKDCVYCGAVGASQTGDHIFARGFFAMDDRDNLPQVPACKACNNAKSKIEAYLATLLPFGGTHPDAITMLTEFVPKRLQANAKLHRILAEGAKREVLTLDGNVTETITIPYNGEQVEALFRYIVRGLNFYHWGQVLPNDCSVQAAAISSAAQRHFDDLLSMNGRRVYGCVGRNVFEYEGLQSLAHPWVTVWAFKAYGGVQVGGDPDAPLEASKAVYAYSARNTMGSLFGD